MLPTTFQQAPAGTSSPATLPVDHIFGSHPETAPVDPELAGREHAAGLGLGCVRGLRYAVAFEALVALALYGLWHFWHVMVH